MKKHATGLATLLVSFATMLSLNFRQPAAGSISGTVEPANGATRVWAFTSKDTVSTSIVNGKFELRDVQPGVYVVNIEATPPYKSVSRTDVTVTDGSATNLGTIILERMK